MYELIAAPYLGKHVIFRPGETRAITIPKTHYSELAALPDDAPIPSWLIEAANRQFALGLAGKPLNPAVLVRQPSRYGYARCSYELNLGCKYGCEFCTSGQSRSRARLARPGQAPGDHA